MSQGAKISTEVPDKKVQPPAKPKQMLSNLDLSKFQEEPISLANYPKTQLLIDNLDNQIMEIEQKLKSASKVLSTQADQLAQGRDKAEARLKEREFYRSKIVSMRRQIKQEQDDCMLINDKLDKLHTLKDKDYIKKNTKPKQTWYEYFTTTPVPDEEEAESIIEYRRRMMAMINQIERKKATENAAQQHPV